MRIANVLHLGGKEFRSLARDRMMLGLIVYAFTVAVHTAATATPETLSQASLSIVDEDRSPLSQRLADAFYPPFFLPPVRITATEMDERLDAGLTTFALHIPPEFQRDVLAGRSPAVQLNVDATRMSQAFTGSGYIQRIVTEEARAFVDRHRNTPAVPVALVERARFNPELRRSWFGGILEVINHVTLLAIVLTGAALIREREHGTVEHLLVMPVTPLEIMASKVWTMALVVLVACGLSLQVVVRGLLGAPVHGSVALFLAGALVHLFATTSMGIFLGTVARSMSQFALLVLLIQLPLEMLSGGTTPRESMPFAVRTVMLAAPTTHFVQLAQGILYRGAGLAVVWPQFLALAGIGSLLFGIALARFRRTIGSMA